MDELQKNQNELYKIIEDLKNQLNERDRQIKDRDGKIESLQKEVKKVMGEKADKDCLIKSKNLINSIDKFSVNLRELAFGKRVPRVKPGWKDECYASV